MRTSRSLSTAAALTVGAVLSVGAVGPAAAHSGGLDRRRHGAVLNVLDQGQP